MDQKINRFKDWQEADRTNPRWRWVLAEKWKVSYTRVGKIDRDWTKKTDPYRFDKNEKNFKLLVRYPGQHRASHLQRKRNSPKNKTNLEISDELLKKLQESHVEWKHKRKTRKHTNKKLKKEETRFKDWQEADRTNPKWRYILAKKWKVSYSAVGKVDRQYKKIAK